MDRQKEFRESSFFTRPEPSTLSKCCAGTILGRQVDFAKLQHYVELAGGYNAMDNKATAWETAVTALGFGLGDADPLEIKQAAGQLRDCAFRWNAFLGYCNRLRSSGNSSSADTESEDEDETEEDDDGSMAVQINISNIQEAITQKVSMAVEELHQLCPSVMTVPKPVREVMQKLETEVRNSAKPPPVRVGLLGGTGIGKTTTQNEMLRMTEVARSSYGRNKSLEALADVNPESVRMVKETTSAILKDSATADIVLVNPPRGNLVQDYEKKEEKTAIEALSVISDPTAMSDFCKKFFKLTPEQINAPQDIHRLITHYLLPVAHPDHTKPTTSHLIELWYGSRFHFEIEYEDLTDLIRYLIRYRFMQWREEEESDGNEYDGNEEEDDRSLLEDRFLECCIENASLPSQRPTEKDLVNMTDEEIEEYVPLKPEIRRVLNKKLVFTSSGLDQFQDRIYIRRLLFLVQHAGLTAVQEQTKETSSKFDFWSSEQYPKSADRHVIKRIRVFVPSLLLQQNICLVDMPGSGDANPYRHMNMTQALDTCDAIICMTASDSIEGDRSLAEVLRSFVGPRFFANNGRRPPKLALFKLAEKSNRLGSLKAHRSDPDREAEIKTVVKYLASGDNLRRATANNLTREQIERIKQDIHGMLSKKFRSLYPMHYSSLVHNPDGNRDFRDYGADLDRTNMRLLIQVLLEACSTEVVEKGEELRKLVDEDLAILETASPTTHASIDVNRFQAVYNPINSAYTTARQGLVQSLSATEIKEQAQARLGNVFRSFKSSLAHENKEIQEAMKNRKIDTLKNAMLSEMKGTYAHKVVPACKRLTSVNSLHLRTFEILHEMEELTILHVSHQLTTWMLQQINDEVIRDLWDVLSRDSTFIEAIRMELRSVLGNAGQTSERSMESSLTDLVQVALRKAFDQVFAPLACDEEIRHRNRFLNEYGKRFVQFQETAVVMIVGELGDKYSQALNQVFPNDFSSGQIMSPLKETIFKFFHPARRYKVSQHNKVIATLKSLRDSLSVLVQISGGTQNSGNSMETRIMNNVALRKSIADLSPDQWKEPIERVQPCTMPQLFDKRKNASELHELVNAACKPEKPNSKSDIHKAVAKVLYEDWNDYIQCKCFKHWRKGVMFRYLHCPRLFGQHFEDQELATFLGCAGKKENGHVSDNVVERSMRDSSMQVPLLQGASDLMGCIFDVEVVGRETDQLDGISIFRIAPQLTSVNAMSVYKLTFNLATGEWSPQYPKSQGRSKRARRS